MVDDPVDERRLRAPAPVPTPGRRGLDVRARALADLFAAAVFGFGGATVALHAGYGLPVALVAAVLSALGGGIMRDLLLGGTPPITLRTPRLPLAALLAGTAAFLLSAHIAAVPVWVVAGLDAAALAIFCAGGAVRSASLGAHHLLAVVLGGVSAVGGGVARDLVLHREPLLLTHPVSGVSALAGAAVTVAGLRSGLSDSRSVLLGLITALVLRTAGTVLGWDHLI